MSWLSIVLAIGGMGASNWQGPPPQGANGGLSKPPQRRDRPQRAYLVSYFVDNGESGIYLGISEDGLKFKPLIEPNYPILKSTLGGDALTRDPCMMYGPDRQWHMVWTTGWWKRTIGLAHSKDLVHWTQQTVPAMVDINNALNAWAPEIVYDGVIQDYVIFWSSTVRGRFASTARPDGDVGPDNEPLNHRYYFTATKDFQHYSPSRLLWDPGFNCIDATMHHSRTGWTLFGKNETRAPEPAKYLFAATMPGPRGPFHMVNSRITGDFWAEGPTAVRADGKYRVYFDRYTEGKWGAVESEDLKSWTDISDRIQMIPGARHGTIMAVSKRFIDRVKEILKAERDRATHGDQNNLIR